MIEEETKSQGIQSIEVGMDILKKIARSRKTSFHYGNSDIMRNIKK